MMNRILPKLVTALSLAAILGVTASHGLALEIRNTSTYVGDGRWNWTIYVEADETILQRIECVEYTLHSTFPDPVRKVCGRPETKFALSSNGWGTFTVKATVRYKNGRVQPLEHRLVFRERSAPASFHAVARNWSRQLEPGWWEWGIYIEGAPAQLDRIRCVEYTLHRSFQNPVRVICSRSNKFQLTARGWGTFDVKIRLMLKDGSVQHITHRLIFR